MDQGRSYKELYDREGYLIMQSCFLCQCGKQIQIPHRSLGGQTSAFIGCATCGIMYPFPQESVSQESVSQESLRRKFATWDENEPKSEFVAFKSEPSGNVLSGAISQSPDPEKSLLRQVISFLEGCLAFLEGCLESCAFYPVALVDDYTSELAQSRKVFLQKVLPVVLGGLAALLISIVTVWYYFEHFGSRDVPQTQLANLLEIPNKSTSKNQSKRPEIVTSGILDSIRMLRMYRNVLSDVPEDKKNALMVHYYTAAKKLSEQSASLQGLSDSSWRNAFEELASEILNDNNSKMVMQLGPIGKLPGVNASSENDFVVTVLRIDESDHPDPSSLWLLDEPWNFGEQQVSVQMLPGAWSENTEMEPTNCLVFGRLVAIDSSNAESSISERGTLTLQVHAAMPE